MNATDHELLERYLDGSASTAEEAALSRLLASNPEAADELARACRLEKELGSAKITITPANRAWPRLALATAAALAISALFGWAWWRSPSAEADSGVANVPAQSDSNPRLLLGNRSASAGQPLTLGQLNECRLAQIDWNNLLLSSAVKVLEDEFNQQRKASRPAITIRLSPSPPEPAIQEDELQRQVNLRRSDLALGDVLEYLAALDNRRLIFNQAGVVLQAITDDAQEMVTTTVDPPANFLTRALKPRPNWADIAKVPDSEQVRYTKLGERPDQHRLNSQAQARLAEWGLSFPAGARVHYDPLGPMNLTTTARGQRLWKAMEKILQAPELPPRSVRIESYLADKVSHMKLDGPVSVQNMVFKYPREGFKSVFDTNATITELGSVLTRMLSRTYVASTQGNAVPGTSENDFTGTLLGMHVEALPGTSKDFTGTALSFVAWPIQDGFALAGRAIFGAKVEEQILHQITDFQFSLKDDDAAVLSCKSPETGKTRWLAFRLTETDAEGRPLRQDGQPVPP